MRKRYFPAQPGEPAPLRVTVARTVRFEEVDSLGIVWHGRYPSYFEDARVALGDRFGIGYMDFHENGIVAPVRIFHVDYHRPLKYAEDFTIEGILHWSEAARMNFEFIVRNDRNESASTGYSVQMMLDRERNILLTPPPFYRAFCERWQRGELA